MNTFENFASDIASVLFWPFAVCVSLFRNVKNSISFVSQLHLTKKCLNPKQIKQHSDHAYVDWCNYDYYYWLWWLNIYSPPSASNTCEMLNILNWSPEVYFSSKWRTRTVFILIFFCYLFIPSEELCLPETAMLDKF